MNKVGNLVVRNSCMSTGFSFNFIFHLFFGFFFCIMLSYISEFLALLFGSPLSP